jgi:hypothetical protein
MGRRKPSQDLSFKRAFFSWEAEGETIFALCIWMELSLLTGSPGKWQALNCTPKTWTRKLVSSWAGHWRLLFKPWRKKRVLFQRWRPGLVFFMLIVLKAPPVVTSFSLLYFHSHPFRTTLPGICLIWFSFPSYITFSFYPSGLTSTLKMEAICSSKHLLTPTTLYGVTT